jgi:hypothetical protein
MAGKYEKYKNEFHTDSFQIWKNIPVTNGKPACRGRNMF